MAILEEQLQEFLDKEYQPAEDSFKIKSDDAANWALKKIKQYEKKIADRKELVQREKERLDAFLAEENEKDSGSIAFFTVKLQEYFRELRDKGVLGNKKSYRLPHGTLGTRKKQAVLERNDEKLMPIARQYGLTETVEKLKWAEFKKRVVVKGYQAVDAETGELIDGVTVVEKEEEDGSFYVKTE